MVHLQLRLWTWTLLLSCNFSVFCKLCKNCFTWLVWYFKKVTHWTASQLGARWELGLKAEPTVTLWVVRGKGKVSPKLPCKWHCRWVIKVVRLWVYKGVAKGWWVSAEWAWESSWSCHPTQAGAAGRVWGCEHPLGHLPPSSSRAGGSPGLSPCALVWPVMWRSGHQESTHWATYVASYLCTDPYFHKAWKKIPLCLTMTPLKSTGDGSKFTFLRRYGAAQEGGEGARSQAL